MFVSVTFALSTGEVKKEFNLDGASQLSEILLWIWRDMVLALLELRGEHATPFVEEILGDIDRALGWEALEALLKGGKGGESLDSVFLLHRG